jgi:CubicO group peptidase (beta-lactamase class C family)
VQRGLITLDTEVSTVLPELANPLILTHFDEANKPVLIPAKNPITLRQLLTHTSGLGYTFSSNHLLFEWRKQNPLKGELSFSIDDEYTYPLIYEPGALGEWCYSVGLDWAGRLVERLNGNIKLGEYMQKHIFTPLGMKDTTFRPLQREELMARMSARVVRDEEGKLKQEDGKIYPVIEPVDDTGGGGLYSTASDYNKVLQSLLRNDGQLLDSSTLEMLFTPQLPAGNKDYLEKLNRTGPGRVLNNFGEKQLNINHGLGGIIAVDGVPGRVGKGMLCWDGMPACFWWVDREGGTCGFYGSQLFPSSDRNTAELFGAFRGACYAAAGN